MITYLLITENFSYDYNYNVLVQDITLISQTNRKCETVIHFRCPRHQKEVHPAGLQQVLVHVKDGGM